MNSKIFVVFSCLCFFAVNIYAGDGFVVHMVKYRRDIVSSSAESTCKQTIYGMFMPVEYIGKIKVSGNRKITCDFFNRKYIRHVQDIYNNGLKNGFNTQMFFKDKPAEYPINGQLVYLDMPSNIWSWFGDVMKNDKIDFIKLAFLNILYEEGYVEIDEKVGEKYFKFKQKEEMNDNELVNATKLRKGDGIYKFEVLRFEAYSENDPVPMIL